MLIRQTYLEMVVVQEGYPVWKEEGISTERARDFSNSAHETRFKKRNHFHKSIQHRLTIEVMS